MFDKFDKFDRWATRPPFIDPTIHIHGGDTREPPPEEDEADDDTRTGSKRKLYSEEQGVYFRSDLDLVFEFMRNRHCLITLFEK